MIFDSIQIEHCHQCKSKDVVTYHLLEWNWFNPELVACCSEQRCIDKLRKTKKITDLTLEEAQVLLIKAKL